MRIDLLKLAETHDASSLGRLLSQERRKMLDREEERQSVLCSKLYITGHLILILWAPGSSQCYLPSVDTERRPREVQHRAQVCIGVSSRSSGLQRLSVLREQGLLGLGVCKMMSWTGLKPHQVVNPTKTQAALTRDARAFAPSKDTWRGDGLPRQKSD